MVITGKERSHSLVRERNFIFDKFKNRLQWCWWHREVGDIVMLMIFVRIFFWGSCEDLGIFEALKLPNCHQHLKLVTNTFYPKNGHQYRCLRYLLQLWIFIKVKRCFYFVFLQLYLHQQFQFFLFSVVSDRIIKFRLRIWFRVSWFFVQRILQRLKQIKLKKNSGMYLGFMPITKITNVVVKMNLANLVIPWYTEEWIENIKGSKDRISKDRIPGSYWCFWSIKTIFSVLFVQTFVPKKKALTNVPWVQG